MKKLFVAGILLLILPAVVAGQDWLRGKEYDVGLDIGSKFSLVAEKGYRMDYVSAMLSFFPEDSWQQEVLNLETEPEAKKINHDYEFKWLNPEAGDYRFSLKAEVKTKNDMQKVTEKIYFPISVDEEYEKWLVSSEHIDSNAGSVIQQASNIAEGNDDLYEIVYDLAKWVNENVEYDADFGEDVENASWVLENRLGTCDEFNSLFVAMCRSLGIPAKYIAGIAYSNLPEIEGFNPHAWAEVYFPDYGWIPFDATYGQFGFVDASHIILKESVDPGEASTTYEWKGLNANFVSDKLQINAFLIRQSGMVEPYISFDVSAAKKSVGFGSYNLIIADVKNLKDYYVSTELYIARPAELELIGRFDKSILLKPNEEKEVYWLVKVPAGLKSSAVYTFPIRVSSLRNISAETEFSSSKSDKSYSMAEMEARMEVFEKKIRTEKIDFSCGADEMLLIENDSASISCFVKNTGNVFLDDLSVCMESICKHIDLGIQQTEQINFRYFAKRFGEHDVVINASNDAVYKNVALHFEVFDMPKIEITEMEHPSEVEYADDFSIRFVLTKKSFSNLYNVVIRLAQDGYERKWEISELSEDEGFVINLKGSDLNKGVNRFKLVVDFEDKGGNSYLMEREFSITLKKIKFWQSIKIWLNKAARWLEKLFTK